ncbi:DUF4398 domain-containing protein [Legionella israelensis]|uniref:DUF4398 domain-containing protein n=2 Tax=Legionella israelensis TaxID=454 RepID=A0AAX1EF61_9GAMM|nr:DUF4398 domain-containing protein [Legionella israelensis]QBS08818.1 DUF4398 domain-containing protein [Legionella israelensis]
MDMKRLVMLLIASFMAVTLAACGESPAEKQEEDMANAAMEQKKDEQMNKDQTAKEDMDTAKQKMDEAKQQMDEAKQKINNNTDETAQPTP